jgi:Zn-dependent peptidase ImmA (M78 family)/DNA-binding XRE family transcriptional regulator
MSSSQTTTQKHRVNPSILQWAREQSVLDIGEVAKTLDIPIETLYAWEQGKGQPDTNTLRELSKLYDYPFSYFFLDKIPKEPPLKDYRGTPKDRRITFSRETLLALREFRRLTRFANMIKQVSGDFREIVIGKASIHEDAEIVAEREAKRLGITNDIRKNWQDKEEAYHAWRETIEKSGIFVISLHMPILECRGAAIMEPPYVAAILVNQTDAVVARSFTLMHEYCHLLLRRERELMVCDQYPSDTESFSNNFAASILVPKISLIQVLKDKGENFYHEWWTDTFLRDLSNNFYVSRDVIAIRLENLEYAPSGFYEEKRRIWYKSVPKKGYGRSKNKRLRAEEKFGSRLFDMTLEAVKSGLMHSVDAAIYMGKVGGGEERPWYIKANDIEKWVEARTWNY